MAPAALGLVEIARLFPWFGGESCFLTTILISFLALAGNAVCIFLLQRSKGHAHHTETTRLGRRINRIHPCRLRIFHDIRVCPVVNPTLPDRSAFTNALLPVAGSSLTTVA